MVKAIIFDVGGVYLHGSFTAFVNRSRRYLGIDQKFSTDCELVFDPEYNKGRITIETCFKEYFGVPISGQQMQKLIEYWTDTWKPEQEMLQLVSALKKNYSLAILSNSDIVNSQRYAKLGWYDAFDPIILSHELGMLKPDKEIFYHVLDKLGLPAIECVFIDDVWANVEVARSLGMNAVLYRSTSQLKTKLVELGVEF